MGMLNQWEETGKKYQQATQETHAQRRNHRILEKQTMDLATYQTDRMGIHRPGNGGKLHISALVGMQIHHWVLYRWRKYEKMENVISSNMSEMWKQGRGQRTHDQVPAPNSRKTMGNVLNSSGKLDTPIKNRANGKDNHTIQAKELEDGRSQDRPTSDRELHHPLSGQIRVEPGTGRSHDNPMEKPASAILEMNQIMTLGKTMDSRIINKMWTITWDMWRQWNSALHKMATRNC